MKNKTKNNFFTCPSATTLSPEEIEVLKSLQTSVLRKFMDKEEIKIVNKLIKKGLVERGTSDDKQHSRQYRISDLGEHVLENN